MARRYSSIWSAIKKHRKVLIRCRPEKMTTLVQGVKKEKAREVAPRRALDLDAYGKLEIVRHREKGEVEFKLVSFVRAENL
jgi:hypothetical protein